MKVTMVMAIPCTGFETGRFTARAAALLRRYADALEAEANDGPIVSKVGFTFPARATDPDDRIRITQIDAPWIDEAQAGTSYGGTE